MNGSAAGRGAMTAAVIKLAILSSNRKNILGR
jgi:hypothetical protein